MPRHYYFKDQRSNYTPIKLFAVAIGIAVVAQVVDQL